MFPEDGLDRHLARERAARLHLLEDRRLFQEPAQVDRHETERAAGDERDAPGEGGDVRRAVDRVDGAGHQRSDQDAGGQPRGERADAEAEALLRHVLGHEHPRARHLAADRDALQDPHQQQQQRRGDADARVGRQQADRQRRHRHQEDAQREHPLAAEQIAEMRDHDPAERARQVAGREDPERLQQPQPVRHVGRKEQPADHRGEEDVDDEVVELERAAERGQRQRAVVVTGQRTRHRAAMLTAAFTHRPIDWPVGPVGSAKRRTACASQSLPRACEMQDGMHRLERADVS